MATGLFSQPINDEIKRYLESLIVANQNAAPQQLKFTLSNAQIASLFSSPYTFLSATPFGYGIKLLNIAARFMEDAGDNYSANTQLIVYSTAAGSSAIIMESGVNFLSYSNAVYTQYFSLITPTGLEDQIIERDSLKIATKAGDPTPNGNPNVTVDVYVTYLQIQL